MKVQIEIEFSDEEIKILKDSENGIKATAENIYGLRKLFHKGLMYEDHNSWGSYYEPNKIGHMILEKLDEN